MASVQIPRGGPPRSIEVPSGKSRSREGSLYAVPGAILHGLTDDETAAVLKIYPKARLIPPPVKKPERVEPSPEKPEEKQPEATDEKPKKRPEPRRK